MLPPILTAMQQLGHTVFLNGDYNLNLFGIRDPRNADTYNDLIGCACKINGQWGVLYWHATTDPGGRYMTNPLAGTKGTASLVPGQYRGVWVIGPHGKSGYNALIQRGGQVDVYRDANLDLTHNYEDSTIERGYFGINIHAPISTPYSVSVDYTDKPVRSASAGCQVHATTQGFLDMMELCKRQVEHGHGDTFSYTLMLLEDVWDALANVSSRA